MIWPGRYVGITLANGRRELWGLEDWIEAGPTAPSVVLLPGIRAALAWAEQHRLLRETPPQDLDRWVDMTARYLTREHQDTKSAEAQVLDIVTSATTATISSTLPEIEDPGSG